MISFLPHSFLIPLPFSRSNFFYCFRWTSFCLYVFLPLTSALGFKINSRCWRLLHCFWLRQSTLHFLYPLPQQYRTPVSNCQPPKTVLQCNISFYVALWACVRINRKLYTQEQNCYVQANFINLMMKKNCQITLQNGCTNLYSWRFPFPYIPGKI